MTRTLVMKRLWLYSRSMKMIYFDKKSKKFYITTILPYARGHVSHSLMKEISITEAKKEIKTEMNNFTDWEGQKIYVSSDCWHRCRWLM